MINLIKHLSFLLQVFLCCSVKLLPLYVTRMKCPPSGILLMVCQMESVGLTKLQVKLQNLDWVINVKEYIPNIYLFLFQIKRRDSCNLSDFRNYKLPHVLFMLVLTMPLPIVLILLQMLLWKNI